ncbi:J domain-containing protein DDB_G0295729 isoform X2 [Condylostylus longicornis]|uniref:J domain-containing protein DDB_G0295729 isoform X2 n=1 Tax=Condylostylus longicornis TaxID=2530218 RepID=UPI00244E23EB|nr:J domain-containing protein DDB_G0295729 isoform X2 [Condylostylus longicornis]
MTVSVANDNNQQNTITTTTTVKSAMMSLAMRRSSSPGNSSGSDNDTINNSSAATALRRLYFKSGRCVKTKTADNITPLSTSQTSTVPKVVIMGTSTTSVTDNNTSTESASTLITNVTTTDTETNGSLDIGDTSGQSEPLLSSLDEPNQTSTSVGSDQEITELELTCVYSKEDVLALDNLEEESSLTIQQQPSPGIPKTAPSISTSFIHFPFDPPSSPRSVKTIQKDESLFTFKEAATYLEQHKQQKQRLKQHLHNHSQKHIKEFIQFESSNPITEKIAHKKFTKLSHKKFPEEEELNHNRQNKKELHQQQNFGQSKQNRKLSVNSCYDYENGDRRPSTKSVSSFWSWNMEHEKENKKRKESCCSAKYIISSNQRPCKTAHELICDMNNFSNGFDDVKKQRKDNNKLQTKNINKFSDKKLSPKQHDKYRYNSKINSASAITAIKKKDKYSVDNGDKYDLNDLTMFPFDKEALDYQRIQRECFTVDNDYEDGETQNSLSNKYYYNFEENSSSTETSSESEKSIYRGKVINESASKLNKYNKTDIFQQYTLLSQQEATNQHHQSQEKKRQHSKQRNRPDYTLQKTKYDHIIVTTTLSPTNKNVVDAAFSPVKPQIPKNTESNSSISPRSIKDLNNFDDISNKFDKIVVKEQYQSPATNALFEYDENHLSNIKSSPSQNSLLPRVIDSLIAQGSNSCVSNDLSSSVYHRLQHHSEQQERNHQLEENNIPNTNMTVITRTTASTLTHCTSPLADFHVDVFLEPLNRKQQHQKEQQEKEQQEMMENSQQQKESSLLSTSPVCHILTISNNKQKLEQQQELHDNLEECQKHSQNTGPINVTPNPMEVAVCTQPRATIVVQQPSLSLDNTVETMLLKNEGDFESVEKTRKSSKHSFKDENNVRQLLDVTNTLTFEELRDFEMRVASMPNTGVEEEYYRLRHFSITGKGIVNRGDSLKSRRSRSNNSVRSNNSSNSSTEHLTATIQGIPPCVGSARTSATCSLASSRESSTSNPGSGPYRVLMLGGPAVGKTSLISQFMTSEYLHAYDTSIDDESGEKSVNVLLNGEESELIFIDLASTEISPENWLSNYDPHGYCIIYSSADRDSFSLAELILQSLWTTENIAQKAVILVGNKADLARSRMITSDEGKSMATAYDCKFIETSVGINHNVDELLVGLLSQIRLKLENPEKSRDLFRKRSSRRNKRACSPLGVPCLSGANNPSNPSSPIGPSPTITDGTPPRSIQCSPRKYRGSRTSASLKVKGLLGRVWARDSKSKSCENLHVL